MSIPLSETFHSFFDKAGFGAVLLDPEQCVVTANSAYYQFTGRKPEQVLGRRCPRQHRCYLYDEIYREVPCRGGKLRGASLEPRLNLCQFACPFRHDEAVLDAPIPIWLETDEKPETPAYRSYSRLLDGEGKLTGVLMFLHPITPLHEALEKGMAELSRLDRELELAARMEKGLVPLRRDFVPGFQYGALTLPYRQVGGDVIEVLSDSSGRAVFYILDVSGKSLPGALVLPVLRKLFRSRLLELSPGLAVARCNEELCRVLPSGVFCAATFLFAREGSPRLQVVCAGQEPVWIQQGSRVCPVEANGPVLGVVPEATYPVASVELTSDSLLAAWSDGLGEILESPQHLLETLTSAGDLNQAVSAVLGSLTRTDDTSLLALRLCRNDSDQVLPSQGMRNSVHEEADQNTQIGSRTLAFHGDLGGHPGL